MEKKIKQVLEKIRPALLGDGGDIEFISFNKKDGELKVKMLGMCAHCPMSQITIKEFVEVEIKKEIPEVKSVISV